MGSSDAAARCLGTIPAHYNPDVLLSTNRSRTIWPRLVGVLLTLAASSSVYAQAVPATGPARRPTDASSQPLSRSLSQISQDFAKLVSAASPSVVQVLATGYGSATPEGTGMGGVVSTQRAGGSGVVLHADGYIVTNAHVVANARRVRIVLTPPTGPAAGQSIVRPAGLMREATLVGLDRETDLAVLKIDETKLTPLPLADSDELQQGHLVMAFGSPLGLENSVTFGVVSGVGRQRAPDDPMVYVQTDAPINPGSSGGPLVDASGHAVGINTYIMSQSGGNEGVGFAVPSNIVRTVFDQLRTTGRVRRGTLGVLSQTITPSMAAGLGLGRTGGVILADVAEGGPGAAAGLRPGDVVLSLDGRPMENARQFEVNLYARRVGDRVTLEIQRGSATTRTTAAIAERPDDPARFAELVDPTENLIARLGILGVGIDSDVAARLPHLRAKGGVLVAGILAGTPGVPIGLEAGDVIIAVNGSPVAALADLRARVDALPTGGACVLQVQRAQALMYIVLELE
ncbi:MAG: PDZ domain-containing protein [Luteitalea sp.]|nr:PDZ domain-containing protein [Luteitalea sp.]